MKRPVTSVINQPNIQPHGGFVSPKDLTEEQLSDEGMPLSLYSFAQLIDLSCKMGVLSPQTIGLIVDYLTRTEIALFFGTSPEDAIIDSFIISAYGAKLANKTADATNLEVELANLYSKEKKIIRKSCRRQASL